MAVRRYVLEVRCDCGSMINIRYYQEFNGQKYSVNCWNCGKVVEANGSSVKIDDKLISRNRVTIISQEVSKK